MERRKFLLTSGLTVATFLAGCSGSGTESSDGGSDDSGGSSSNDSSGDSDSGSNNSEGTTENTSSSDDSEEDSDESEESDDSGGSSTYEVTVEYGGEWSGAVAADGSSRSVDGSGEETLTVDGDPSSISANAQKKDDSSDELTIKILENGEVVAEQSTTAEYGVAQASYSNF